MDKKVEIKSFCDDNRHDWSRLYTDYATFYELQMSPKILDTVWDWIHDSTHEIDAVGAFSGGVLLGIAHYRRYAQPVFASYGLYLDDLFVDKNARRLGVASSLLLWLKNEAARRNLDPVRWQTAPSNQKAQAVYDQLAKKTDWQTYDMSV